MPSQAVLELLIELKDQASDGLSSLGGALSSLGGIAGGVALAGVAAFGAAVVSGIGDAREAAQLMAQTEAVIKSTGGAAGVSAQQVADYASSLSAASGASLFGDDQIQQSENLLLTFTNIKDKTLEAATAISVDMAQALGGAPKDSAIQLGKALNDPIAGITALTRVGVTFTDEQKAQIKAMQNAGNMAGAQQVILAELNKEFGGSAAAAAKADGGWAQFQDRMGEAAETVGTALLPLLTTLAGFMADTIAPAIETAANALAAWLSDPAVQAGIQQIADAISTGLAVAFDVLANQVIPGLVAAWGLLAPVVAAILPLFSSDMPSALGSTAQTFGMLQTTVGAVMSAIQAIVAAVLPQIAAFWQAHGAEILAFVQQTWNAIQSIIQLALQIIQATIVPVLAAIAGFIRAHGTEIQAILGNTLNAIKALIDAALTLIQGVLRATLQIIQGDWSGAWETIQQMSARFVTDIGTVIQSGLNNLKVIFGGVIDWIKTAWDGLISGAASIGRSLIEGIIAGAQAAAGDLFNALAHMAADALKAAKDAIGFGSPAREAMPIGASIVQGVIVGIDQTAGALSSAMAGLSAGVVGGANRAVDQLIGALGRPDLSGAVKQFRDLASFGINTNADTLAGAFGGGGSSNGIDLNALGPGRSSGRAGDTIANAMQSSVTINTVAGQNPHQIAKTTIDEMTRQLRTRRA